MKKTIKNYCLNATQSKLGELYEIAKRYVSVKNNIFQRYGSLSGLQYLSYPRQIRDEWVKTRHADKFNMQARYWKHALEEAFSNIQSNWSNGFNKIRHSLHRNQSFSKDEKHYAFYLLKATDLLYKAVALESFTIPDKFQNMKIIRRDKIHKYLKNRLRKYTGNKPYQFKNRSFQIDHNMYNIYKDVKGRLWIGIMGLTPRKRIMLQMSSSVEPAGNLRIVLKDKNIEIHNAVKIAVKETIKNKNRNKLRSLSDKYEKRGDIVKAEVIKKNNLGRKKYFYQKQINLNEIKRIINLSLNQFIKEERPAVLVTEDLTFTNWNRKLSKKVKRYFSSWLKGYLQEQIDYKTLLNGIQQVVVNPAYGSQVCHLCRRFGVRRGDKFYCEIHGVLDADHNAALNYLARMPDTEINIYTPYRKVKDILRERLRLSNKDSRYSVINITGQSESERAEYV